MKVRHAAGTDLDAIRSLHIESWQRTYRGMLPDAYLEGSLEKDLSGYWREDRLQGQICCVAHSDGVVGFAILSPLGPETPHVASVHVARDVQGKGIARSLFRFLASALRDQGRDGLCLEVLEGNTRARKAYSALGGREGVPVPGDCFGHPVTDIPIIWDSLDPLLEK